MAAFLANVGVNAGHAARSPLFQDGTFRLLPVPEALPWKEPMVRLAPDLLRYAPPTWREHAVHVDPDLASPTPTYGDNCRTAGRAFALRRAAAGDVIVFLARLDRAGGAGFHLVGCLEIDDAITDVANDPGAGWWDDNAHIRRSRATGRWNSFWVFKGTHNSRLFNRAIPFRRAEADALFGGTWWWRPNRSELQTIGSYTRAIRRIEGPGEQWLRALCRS